MSIYVNLFLVAVVVVYIVDLSGFTQSWRSGVARLIGVAQSRLRPLPPFDCSTCAVWWAGLVLAAVRHDLTFATLAFAALCSLLAMPAGILMNSVRDALSALAGMIGGRL